MRKAYWMCVLLACSSLSIYAEQPKQPTVTASILFMESLPKPRFSRVGYDKPVAWTDITLSLPEGFSLRLWHYAGLNDSSFSSNAGDESYFIGSWKLNSKDFDLSLSLTYINQVGLDRFDDNDVFVGTFAIGKSFTFGDHTIRPEFKTEWAWKVDNFSDGAVILMPNVTDIWKKPFGIDRLTLVTNAMIQWNSQFGALSGDGVFLQINSSAVWRITKDIDLIMPGYLLITPIVESNDVRGSEGVLYGGLRFKF